LLGTLQTMGNPNGIKRPFPFTHALSLDEYIVQHTCGAHYLSWSPNLSRNKRNMPFYFWSNRTLPWGKCHCSANITEFVRVIYALPGHFYKYTPLSMTVECQLQLSRHNSHERTWGHHLKYDLFRTTLNKNWRELTANSFTDHVTNTCSEDSRSRDFIVVRELRRPLRVLPTFEEGDLIYSWKKVKFQAITVTRKLELSLKFLCHFRIQRPQNSKVWLVSFPLHFVCWTVITHKPSELVWPMWSCV